MLHANDWIFVEIARRLDRCQLVFFTHVNKNPSDKFRVRLKAVFEQECMSFEEHCVFIPWQTKPGFFGLLRRADVFLDTIGFSGFNTAMQAIECGLPVVALDGKFMRGRLASGILKRLRLPELVAHTAGEYVDIAVALSRTMFIGSECATALRRLATPYSATSPRSGRWKRSWPTRHMDVGATQPEGDAGLSVDRLPR